MHPFPNSPKAASPKAASPKAASPKAVSPESSDVAPSASPVDYIQHVIASPAPDASDYHKFNDLISFTIETRDKNALKKIVYNTDHPDYYYEKAIKTAKKIDKIDGYMGTEPESATQFVELTLSYEDEEDEDEDIKNFESVYNHYNHTRQNREETDEKKHILESYENAAFVNLEPRRPDIVQSLKEFKKPKIFSKLVGSKKKSKHSRSVKKRSAKKHSVKRQSTKKSLKKRSTRKRSTRKRSTRKRSMRRRSRS